MSFVWMVSLFQNLKNKIKYSRLPKVGMQNRACTVCTISLIVASVIVIIPSMIILILAKVSEEQPRVFHASVQENASTLLSFDTAECPKVAYFYDNPAQQKLYLRIYTDSRAIAGLSLSFYSEEKSGRYFGRFALCYAIPSSSCELQIPKNTHFYALVEADSDLNSEISTVIFRWECHFSTNAPLIIGSVFFGLSIGIILVIGLCWYLKSNIIQLAVSTENRLHLLLKQVGAGEEKRDLETPQQYVFEDLTISSHS